MLNSHSVKAVRCSAPSWCEDFRAPLYDSFSFSRIPDTVKYLLTGDPGAAVRGLPSSVYDGLPTRVGTVVLILADAFGWRQFERFALKHPFLRRFVEEGVASMLTSQFPSTTTVHLTTLHTGLPVGASGIPEWFYYEPKVGGVISALKFGRAGFERETLRAEGFLPADLLPGPALYERLGRMGVCSHLLLHESYSHSSYSTHMSRGAEVIPFKSLSDAVTSLTEVTLRTSRGTPRYILLYLDEIDGVCHEFGPKSVEAEEIISRTFTLLEECFFKEVHGRVGDAALILTADHGQAETDPRTVRYLNREVPDLVQHLKRDAAGSPFFGGSCRDLFLYVKEGRIAEVRSRLTELLGAEAVVRTKAELIDEGFFGAVTNRHLLPRLGDLIVLPLRGKAVYWFEEGRFQMEDRGSHGGLLPEEMETGIYITGL